VNLHGIIAPVIAAVNPLIPVSIQVSVGQGAPAPDGTYPPAYATPGQFVGSINGTTLTVTSVQFGVVQVGQTLADLTGNLLLGTSVVEDTGGGGGPGTYEVSEDQEVTSETMTTSVTLPAQIQPVTWRDLQQLEGLNLNGVRYKIYVYGQLDGVVRPELKGGDLIVVPPGNRHSGVYLIAQALEQFPDWISAAATLQNGS
jgi:hypothetical protein